MAFCAVLSPAESQRTQRFLFLDYLTYCVIFLLDEASTLEITVDCQELEFPRTVAGGKQHPIRFLPHQLCRLKVGDNCNPLSDKIFRFVVLAMPATI